MDDESPGYEWSVEKGPTTNTILQGMLDKN